jgi:hypothetical protein
MNTSVCTADYERVDFEDFFIAFIAPFQPQNNRNCTMEGQICQLDEIPRANFPNAHVRIVICHNARDRNERKINPEQFDEYIAPAVARNCPSLANAATFTPDV